MSEYSENINFIDLAAQQDLIRHQIDNAIKKVLDHGVYIMGPEVFEFENMLKDFTGCNNAITCANGTDAITIALMAIGVSTGDAVFVPSFTYVASAEAPAQLGATPFFVDVDEDTFNININSFKTAILDSRKMGLNPKVVIPVDLFGYPSNINEIEEVAKEEDIKIVVDAAQSFGGSIDKTKVGNFGDITTTSFFPAKPLGCYGDGGAIFTGDDELAEIITSIKLHGKGRQKYDNVRIGLNSRLDTIQAAILIEKLKIFPKELLLRNSIAKKYTSLLSDLFITPEISEGYESAWAQYTLRLPNRKEIQEKLKNNNIPSVIYYPKALSQQDGYKHYPCVSSGVAVSEKLTSEVLSLPMYPYIDKKVIERISSVIRS